jgi:isopentenyl diphosphate isomerase/L-lactate dehydrogenase-like FMN-dependent dehydrogenase
VDPSLTWSNLEWLRSRSPLPLVIKGVLTAEDALLAVGHGAAGIVVSNHGGRQLDGVPATLDVLPEIVDAVGGKVEVLLDGGVRRGTDVLKALALGARAVFAGRAVIWGLATAGEAGAKRVLELLQAESELGLTLLGAPTPEAVTRAHVRRAGPSV